MDDPLRQVPPSLHELRLRREAILRLARHHGAREVRVFGSVARGDADVGSDIDFLVDMEAGRRRGSPTAGRWPAGNAGRGVVGAQGQAVYPDPAGPSEPGRPATGMISAQR